MNHVASFHLIIHGRVQGVGYRAWTGSKARALGLNGWVRNRHDGTVEAVVSGPEAIVHEMLQACHKGPLAAKVTRIDLAAWAGEIPHGFSKRETV